MTNKRQKEKRKKRGNYEGSFNQLSNGTWRGRVCIKGKKFEVFASTISECRKQIRKIVEDETLQCNDKIKLSDWLDKWLSIKSRGISKNTYYRYRIVINKHLKPQLGEFQLKKIDSLQLEDFMCEKLEKEKLSPNTVNQIHSVLNSAFVEAIGKKRLIVNPLATVKRPKIPDSEHIIYSDKEIKALGKEILKSPYSLCLLLMLGSGMRIGEALAVKWSHIDLNKKTVSIKDNLCDLDLSINPTKTDGSRRKVELPEFVIKALLQVPARNRFGLITTNENGRPIKQDKIRAELTSICAALKLPRLTPHELRHNHASHLLSSFLPLSDVSRRLGHTKTDTTGNIYSHQIPESQDKAAKAFEEIFTGKNNNAIK